MRGAQLKAWRLEMKTVWNLLASSVHGTWVWSWSWWQSWAFDVLACTIPRDIHRCNLLSAVVDVDRLC